MLKCWADQKNYLLNHQRVYHHLSMTQVRVQTHFHIVYVIRLNELKIYPIYYIVFKAIFDHIWLKCDLKLTPIN